jgi:hypothetical protein
MTSRSPLLMVDAVVNLALGGLLLVFPRPLVSLLGAPPAVSAFYPSILGAVLVGIGLALVASVRRGPSGGGLGELGAMAINLCGAGALVAWLVFGGLDLPLRGRAFLWTLGVGVIVLAVLELSVMRAIRPGARRATDAGVDSESAEAEGGRDAR